jgi:hypothetical protein
MSAGKLFVLKLPEPRGADLYTRYRPVAPVEAPAEKCTACGGATAPPAWLGPHRADLIASAAVLADVAFGPRTDLLVTQQFIDFWKAARLTGLTGFEPVTIGDISATTTFNGAERDYFHCAVSRTDAMIDDKESEAERTGGMPCNFCGYGGVLKHLRRVVLRNAPLPGPDVFVVKGLTTAVLANRTFAEAWKASRLSGCQLVPADEIRAL